MKFALSILSILPALPLWGALNVPVTVQEAGYSGSKGVSRTDEPFCVGIPVANAAGLTGVETLGLSGSPAAQFRVLGRWPDGKVKWVKVCGIVPSVAAGGTASLALTDGAGNFGGTNLATDSGSTIIVSTGTAVFNIKKANFNVINAAVVGGKTVIAPGSEASRGLVMIGPNPNATFPANVTCGTGAGQSPCTTEYSSANDPSSTAVIEEDGPVMTVIRANGNHIDAAGHVYMQYTARLTFFRNKNTVKVTTILRNANYDVSTKPSVDCNSVGGVCKGLTFNTAYKGFQGYELRLAPSLTGTLNYTVATDSAPQVGTLNQPGGADSVYIYQGQSKWMTPVGSTELCGYQSACGATYTRDVGYVGYKNGTKVTSGDQTKVIGGWADIADSSGAGIVIGIPQMSAQWPAALEFSRGGSDVRVGIFARQNSQPEYQAWPAWAIREQVLIFHDTGLTSPGDEFLKMQHYLIARAGFAHYNATSVFPYKIVDPSQEDGFYATLASATNPPIANSNFCYGGGSTNCTPDRSPTDTTRIGNAMAVGYYRAYPWGDSGPLNQAEFRLSDLWKFLQRGHTGRYLNSSNFYRFMAERAWPHADGKNSNDSTLNGFRWRDRPHASAQSAEVEGHGEPKVACGGNDAQTPEVCATISNSLLSQVSWVTHDPLHAHWTGILYYYFMTGDETIKDSLVPLKDYYLNNDSYQGVSRGSGYPARAVGIQMTGAARFSEFLTAVGDSDASGVLAQGINQFDNFIEPDPCISGYPAGCIPPVVDGFPPRDPPGVSRVRGLVGAEGGRGTSWCAEPAYPYGYPHIYRTLSVFQASLVEEGILDLRRVIGPAWAKYNLALDLAYGISQWALTESSTDDGQNHWFVGGGTDPSTDSFYNGMRVGVVFDVPNTCAPPSTAIKYQTSSIGGKIYDNRSLMSPVQGMWMLFYVQSLVNGQISAPQQRIIKNVLSWDAIKKSVWPADFGHYQLGAVIDTLKNPSDVILQDVPFTAQENAGGSYTLSWTVPINARNYRIKWSPKIIMPSTDLLNFDPMTNTFGTDPSKYANWFAANNIPEPAPSLAGSTQSVTITAGTAGLKAANFSVKAYISAESGGAPPAGPAANLVLVSGNNQSGSAGQALAAPFAVKVTDSAGNPSAGVSVTFAVTSGGGALSATQVATNGQGVATAILTLGAASGANSASASVSGLTGSPIVFTATGTLGNGGAANLVLVSGNNQSGVAGQPLGNPFTVRVTDASGNTIAGTVVTFAVTSGGGTLNAMQVSTNAQGLASSILTLGTSAGVNTVTAAVAGLTGSPIAFTATGTAPSGPAVSLVLVSGSGQSSAVGQALSSPFTVKVTDGNGIVVAGTAVTFAVTTGGGTLSATQATTNAQGLASTVLTLGPAAGANTVTVSAAGLTGSPITFTATGLVSSGSEITWVQQTSQSTGWPSFVGWHLPLYDAVSQQTLIYAGPPSGPHGIYSTDMWAYKAASNSFTQLLGTGSQLDLCPADLPGMPGDRHPGWQMTIDTRRNLMWMYGGTNQMCNGSGVTTNGTAVTWASAAPFVVNGSWTNTQVIINGKPYTVESVKDSTHLTLTTSAGVQSSIVLMTLGVTDGNPRKDMYALSLNENPKMNAWTQYKPAHFPASSNAVGAMVYDSDNDVLFAYGYDSAANLHNHFVYCRTAENPSPGSPTVRQLAAGCSRPDDWNEVTVLGGIQPKGSYFPGMVYDPVTKKVIMYGGGWPDGATFFNQTWAYDTTTRVWTQKALASVGPPVYDGSSTAQPAMAYNSKTGKVLFHQVGKTGAADWEYDPVADRWRKLASGLGSPNDQTMTYDAANNRLISWGINKASGRPDIWHGILSQGTSPIGPTCDLSGDGLVNALDVDLAVKQSLGQLPCGTADLNGDGQCNVLDIQRIIYTGLGGSCKIN